MFNSSLLVFNALSAPASEVNVWVIASWTLQIWLGLIVLLMAFRLAACIFQALTADPSGVLPTSPAYVLTDRGLWVYNTILSMTGAFWFWVITVAISGLSLTLFAIIGVILLGGLAMIVAGVTVVLLIVYNRDERRELMYGY